MNVPATHLDEAEPGTRQPSAGSADRTMKFTYPSGSRPLDGYTIKRGVGRGGFGEVYFATSDAGKEVAIKLIRRNLEVELRGVTQCLNLKHPNLIGLYDIRGDDTDDQWVIMEYVSGESLEDAIDRHPSGMPVDEALAWMRGMCAGVAYLHDHGIVHRDLKPGNVFLDEGTVKIGDYGLAKFISCSRRSGQTESVGTVHYMAPEIANGRYGREIDTYALGIILFEMLTGHVPFEGESVGEVLMKHLTAEPDLSRLNEPYRGIVERALAKDPDVRLKSVGELLALLPGDGAAASAAVWPAPPASPSPAKIHDLPYTHQAAPAAAPPSQPRPSVASTGQVEEPIWKALRDGVNKLRQKWHGDEVQKLGPLQKALLLFALVIAFMWFAPYFMAFAFPALVCYGVYYLVWVSLIRPSGMAQAVKRIDDHVASGLREGGNQHRNDATVAWQPPMSAADRYAERVRRRRMRPSWRERANQELAGKPLRVKVTELLGSMLLAALIAAVAATIGPLLLDQNGSPDPMATHLWLALVGTVGSWAILVPTKFAEGKLEDQVPMRIVLLSLGALVGLAAWALGDLLMLQWPNWGVGLHETAISGGMLNWRTPAAGAPPTMAICASYFAFLFLLLRWWRQAEYTRSTRFSVWSVVVCLFWAWLLHMFWWFPQPAGIMAAGVIAVSTQLASPWMPPSRRRALTAEAEAVA